MMRGVEFSINSALFSFFGTLYRVADLGWIKM